MEYRQNTTKYLELVLTPTLHLAQTLLQKDKIGIDSMLIGVFLDCDVPKTTTRQPLQADSFIANRHFAPLQEILSTAEAIENIQIYARTFPYAKRGVSRVAYLKYHISAYLNEVSVLRNRMISYLTHIQRDYKEEAVAGVVTDTTARIRSTVQRLFDPLLTNRHRHVHESRYTTRELDRLNTLELLWGARELRHRVETMYIDRYKKVRRRWINGLNDEFEVIHLIFEFYFGELLEVVAPNGVMLIPSKFIKESSP